MTERPAPHLFTRDLELPPDISGRFVCGRCHLLGRPGDAHHDVPDRPEQALARTRVDPHDE